MPRKDIDSEAVYTEEQIADIMRIAAKTSPLAFALTAWCYEFGARTAEPGMQFLRDLDLPNGRARPLHLKGGKNPSWHYLLPYCQTALPRWIAKRGGCVKKPEQNLYLFPSKTPGKCLTCGGTGQRAKQMREGEKRFPGPLVSCHHCNETGKRWGMDRREVYNVVAPILRAAGMPKGRQHPHTLRHSIITHMLNSGVEPNIIQNRIGHRRLATTLAYVQSTEQARADVVHKMRRLYEKFDAGKGLEDEPTDN
jgi:integrase